MPREATWKRELDSVKGIKQVFIKYIPSRDTPWAIQEPDCSSTQVGPKMDDQSQGFTLL